MLQSIERTSKLNKNRKLVPLFVSGQVKHTKQDIIIQMIRIGTQCEMGRA